jgi:hypothetical protein
VTCLPRIFGDAVLAQRSTEGLRNGPHRIERSKGILVNDLRAEPIVHEIATVHAPDVLAPPEYQSGGRTLQTNDNPPQSRLPAATLANQGQDLTLLDPERDIHDGADSPASSEQSTSSKGYTDML